MSCIEVVAKDNRYCSGNAKGIIVTSTGKYAGVYER